MTFDEIVFHNFGVYQGQHSIPLTTGLCRPVLLIGALNGSGKTTCLEGLQLALYGNRSPFLASVDGGYNSYLADSINRFAPKNAGASVEVAFKAEIDGKYDYYRVVRSWKKNGAKVSEYLHVFRSGLKDEYLSESWIDHMEELLPSRVADLFFFDGERIESLADPQRSSAYLRTAIDALLGLDVIKNLEKDLIQVERKKRAEASSPSQKRELAEIDELFKKLLAQRQSIDLEIRNIQESQHGIKENVSELHAELQRNGGDLFNRKDELERRQSELNTQIQRIHTSLEEHANGLMPLVLVRKLISKTANTVTAAQAWKQEAKIGQAISDYREKLAQLLEAEGQLDALNLLNKFQIPRNAPSIENVKYLELFSNIEPSLFKSAALFEQFSILEQAIKKLIADEQKANSELVVVQRSIEAVPNETRVSSLLDGIRRNQVEQMRLEGLLAACEASLAELSSKLTTLEKQRAQLLEGELKDKEVARVTEHSARVRNTLVQYQIRLRKKHVDRLQAFIEQSFSSLIRKKTLITRVQINPDSCELTLFTAVDHILPASQLSAGERQLLAVAILSALAKASGREMPVVIDTPLGRLDETHRALLVKNYFPTASHQIILLSTDSEIVGSHYKNLKPYTSKEMTLQFDEELKSTIVKHGYFSLANTQRAA